MSCVQPRWHLQLGCIFQMKVILIFVTLNFVSEIDGRFIGRNGDIKLKYWSAFDQAMFLNAVLALLHCIGRNSLLPTVCVKFKSKIWREGLKLITLPSMSAIGNLYDVNATFCEFFELRSVKGRYGSLVCSASNCYICS